MDQLSILDEWFFREVLPLEPVIVEYLSRNWGSESEIEDLRQEVFVKVYESARTEIPAAPRQFVLQMAQNILFVRKRRDKVIPIGSLTDLDALNPESDEPSPERRTAALQEIERLQVALNNLPDRCREVVVLRKIRGLGQREVARQLGIEENTVEQHLSKGLRLLAQSASNRRGSVVAQARRYLSVSSSADD
jgi:RNA polymerase sigma-70 factor (ECF subfamily)